MLNWFYRPQEEEQCRNLTAPSQTQFIVSCALIGWVLLCYIPQWARIVSRRSAKGISSLYILLGSLSGVCAVGNIMMLPSSIIGIGCCRSDARFACINNLLGMFQVAFGIGCFWIVLFMFYYYSEEEVVNDAQQRGAGAGRTVRRAHQAQQVLLLSNGFAGLILVISAIILHFFPQLSQVWADVLGLGLAVGACFQWLPQIITTWRLGHLGSFSAAGLCFLAPYTWIFGISMIVRVGITGWSAWIVYVLVGTMQLVLLGLAIFFRLRQPHQQTEDARIAHDKVDLPLTSHAGMSQVQVDESSPLLVATKGGA